MPAYVRDGWTGETRFDIPREFRDFGFGLRDRGQ